MDNTVLCHSCGLSNHFIARFCRRCGAQLKASLQIEGLDRRAELFRLVRRMENDVNEAGQTDQQLGYLLPALALATILFVPVLMWLTEAPYGWGWLPAPLYGLVFLAGFLACLAVLDRSIMRRNKHFVRQNRLLLDLIKYLQVRVRLSRVDIRDQIAALEYVARKTAQGRRKRTSILRLLLPALMYAVVVALFSLISLSPPPEVGLPWDSLHSLFLSTSFMCILIEVAFIALFLHYLILDFSQHDENEEKLLKPINTALLRLGLLEAPLTPQSRMPPPDPNIWRQLFFVIATLGLYSFKLLYIQITAPGRHFQAQREWELRLLGAVRSPGKAELKGVDESPTQPAIAEQEAERPAPSVSLPQPSPPPPPQAPPAPPPSKSPEPVLKPVGRSPGLVADGMAAAPSAESAPARPQPPPPSFAPPPGPPETVLDPIGSLSADAGEDTLPVRGESVTRAPGPTAPPRNIQDDDAGRKVLFHALLMARVDGEYSFQEQAYRDSLIETLDLRPSDVRQAEAEVTEHLTRLGIQLRPTRVREQPPVRERPRTMETRKPAGDETTLILDKLPAAREPAREQAPLPEPPGLAAAAFMPPQGPPETVLGEEKGEEKEPRRPPAVEPAPEPPALAPAQPRPSEPSQEERKAVERPQEQDRDTITLVIRRPFRKMAALAPQVEGEAAPPQRPPDVALETTTETRGRPFATKLSGLVPAAAEKAIIQAMIGVANANGQVSAEQGLDIEQQIRASNLSPRRKKELRDQRYTPLAAVEVGRGIRDDDVRRTIMFYALLVAHLDGQCDPQERAYVDELMVALGLEAEDEQEIMGDVEQYLRQRGREAQPGTKARRKLSPGQEEEQEVVEEIPVQTAEEAFIYAMIGVANADDWVSDRERAEVIRQMDLANLSPRRRLEIEQNLCAPIPASEVARCARRNEDKRAILFYALLAAQVDAEDNPREQEYLDELIAALDLGQSDVRRVQMDLDEYLAQQEDEAWLEEEEREEEEEEEESADLAILKMEEEIVEEVEEIPLEEVVIRAMVGMAQADGAVNDRQLAAIQEQVEQTPLLADGGFDVEPLLPEPISPLEVAPGLQDDNARRTVLFYALLTSHLEGEPNPPERDYGLELMNALDLKENEMWLVESEVKDYLAQQALEERPPSSVEEVPVEEGEEEIAPLPEPVAERRGAPEQGPQGRGGFEARLAELEEEEEADAILSWREKRFLNIMEVQKQMRVLALAGVLKMSGQEFREYIHKIAAAGLFSGYVDWDEGLVCAMRSEEMAHECPKCKALRQTDGEDVAVCEWCGVELFT